MFKIAERQIEWAGRSLKLETGRIARQADAAVLVTYGDTVVLATVVAQKNPLEKVDFLPLSVHYQEKYYAAGRIPGGYGAREGRPSEREVLISRLIDRPVRPLFMPGFHNEVQVIATLLSHDLENDPDIVAMIASSAAITLSGLPFMGPIAAAKIGFIDGQYVLNPTLSQLGESDLDLIVSGTAEAVMMVESQANQLSEKQMLDAVLLGHKLMQPVVKTIMELTDEVQNVSWAPPTVRLPNQSEEISREALPLFEKALQEKDKLERSRLIGEVEEGLLTKFSENIDETEQEVALLGSFFKKLKKKVLRDFVLNKKSRLDGRQLTEVRQLDCQVGLLPRVHGSALFTRGETQSMAAVALGVEDDAMFVDALDGSYRERFILHYNFPPFSVGEVGRMGATGRREIGHGKLAWRALRAVLPSSEEFPYTIRVVSEIFESNGSSSMATVCSASLSLMNAGVPLLAPVAGIAMGLIKEGEEFSVLTDIRGDEDDLGDMDFKVAGTLNGITALQMDIKISGINAAIMEQALEQARVGRLEILEAMNETISRVANISDYAPRVEVIKIPVDKIREVIGTGGKVIRSIVDTTGAKIDIKDDGNVKIASSEPSVIEAARKMIEAIVLEPEVGQIYEGPVVKVMDFGVFVNFMGSRDGLVHISQMADRRLSKPSDVASEGDIVKVKFLGFDDRGKAKLSMKQV